MIVELINTGSELMLGRVLNTHQQWLCRKLADLGYPVTRQVAIADTGSEIQQAVRESLSRAGLVIVTGGLGPTSDDITRDLIAELLGKPLHEDAAMVARITEMFAKRSRPMPPRVLIQARIPEGAIILDNDIGTAPGLVMKVAPNPHRPDGAPAWLVMLPGPPRELHPMFLNHLVPFMNRELPPSLAFVCRTLKSTGMGESAVEEKIEKPLEKLIQAGLQVGYCARFGEVDVRLVARGETAARMVSEAEQIVRSLIGKYIFSVDDQPLEEAIVRTLAERKQTLALAESCTGGFLSNRVTNVPGASAVLFAGYVTYSNASKIQSLGVKPETLAAHGAVSEPVAREMAEGARTRSGVDFAIAVTGIAGPGGGTPEKPVGTVFIALASERGTVVLNPTNRYDRETFKFVTSQQALDLLRRTISDS